MSSSALAIMIGAMSLVAGKAWGWVDGYQVGYREGQSDAEAGMHHGR